MPADIKDFRGFVRRLLLAEILQPTGRPGPLEPPPTVRRPRMLRMRGGRVMQSLRPRSGQR
ncbi:MAG: hypothetical protein JRG91_10885 [Deltaproteobacteria bacterium]|nr:hypothetical protein [Deltaproteobacteria bacterium]